MHTANYLAISQLSVGYRRRAILSDLNLSAAEGELVALIGRNGTGKSTLIRTVARLQPALSGNVLIDGKPVGQYSRNDFARLLSIVSTESVGVAHLTVRQLVAFGRFPYTGRLGRLTERDAALVEEALQMVGMKSLENKNLHEISDGERQRAMIARTLAQDTGIILLDEPTAFLDMPNKYEVIRLLHRLTREKRKTIVFSTHDLNIAMEEADKLWLMVDNTLFEGAPEDLVLNRQLSRVFEGTKLHFDDNKGTFKIKRPGTRVIHLSGNGKAYFWTKKALERLGFSVRKGLSGDGSGIVLPDENLACPALHRHGRQIQFDSIYDLSQYLMEN